ncbi:MAG: NAD(P)-dependent oxidoreductase [Spirochaetaceae bacterium]|nr:NAD(P)-dependent oxidoreductase [Spirochaetaceae bacterium]
MIKNISMANVRETEEKGMQKRAAMEEPAGRAAEKTVTSRSIVIAGASGYLGRRLVERLITPPQEKITDNNILLLPRSTSRIADAVKGKTNVFIYNSDGEHLQERIQDFSPDVIYCAACCYETIPEYLHKTVDANYAFPARLLRIAAGIETKKVRFISIGTSLPPQLNLYSLTKKHFSELGEFFHQEGRIEFLNVLLESFYGECEPENRFIPRSILRLKANQDVLLTEGRQRRDYILIDDIIEILHFLLDCGETALLAEAGYTLPVGTGIAPSIRELIQFLRDEINSRSVLKFGAIKMRKNEPSTMADISLLRRIGFSKPLTYWKDGMKKVIRSFK